MLKRFDISLLADKNNGTFKTLNQLEFFWKTQLIRGICKRFHELINDSIPDVFSFLKEVLEIELTLLAGMDLEKQNFIPNFLRIGIDLPVVLAKKVKSPSS